MGFGCLMISLMAPLTGRPLCGGQLAFSSLPLPPLSHPTRQAERMTQWEKVTCTPLPLRAACLSMHVYTQMHAEPLYVNVCKGENVGRRNCLLDDSL